MADAPSHIEPAPEPRGQSGGARRAGVTLRVLPWLLVLLPLNAWWVGQIEVVKYWASPTMVSLFYNAVFLLALVVGLNALLKLATRPLGSLGARIRDSVALAPRHLVVIYAAMCVVSSMASLDNFQLQAVGITHWKAHATPENSWAELFHDLVPKDVVVSDPVALRNLVEGGSSLYRPENYSAWLGPVLWWASYAGAVWLVTLCMAAVFRRRWLESERLQFPITEVPMEMISERATLWRDGRMWGALVIVFLMESCNALHTIEPRVPKFPFKVVDVPSLHFNNALDPAIGNAIGLLYLSFYPFAIGLTYLLPVELVFSTLCFWWFYKLQFVVAVKMGLPVAEGNAPFADQQMFGGYLALGFLSVWLARGHLARVLRTALGRPGGYDDRDEPWPYRTQLILLAIGVAYTLWFAIAKTGMAWWVTPLFFGVYFTLSLAVMRIRAEMGIPAHDLLVKGPVQTIPNILGTRAEIGGHRFLDDRTLVSFALHRFYNRGYRGHVAPHQIEAFKMAERTGLHTRGLANMLWLLLPLGVLLTFWATAQALYVDGSDAKAATNNVFYGNEPWDELVRRMESPPEYSRARLVAAVIGFAGTLLMMAGHARVTGWPVHPIGYALGNCWAVHWLWGPMTIGWAAKVVTLRYGGNRSYRVGRMIAIGMILGDFFAGGFWDLIGLWQNRMFLRIWS